MQKLYGALIVLTVLVVLGAIVPQKTDASDGVTYLRSTTLENHKCKASSLLMPDGSYPILVGCEGIVYPVNQPNATFFYYILWASPLDGSSPQRLGELGRGRASFSTNNSFSNLFVTTEDTSNPRAPIGRVVMQGKVIDFESLDPGFSPTPTTKGEQPEEVITPTPVKNTTPGLISTLRRVGLAAALGIIALIVLVFVITRPR